MSSGSVITTNASGDLLFGAGASCDTVTKAGNGFTSAVERVRQSHRGPASHERGRLQRHGDPERQRLGAAHGRVQGPTPGLSTPPRRPSRSPRRSTGAQVSDIVNVTADASDDVGVAGVQFFVDGVDDRAEDTAAPYALSWDTRTLANGAHTLTARARDAAGNTELSAPVTVNVANTSSFQNEVLATGFDLPTAIKFLPDGRMLVARAGRARSRSCRRRTRRPTPRRSSSSPTSARPACSRGSTTSRSTPNFATNHYYYVFYTLGTPNRDRLSRFTANADAHRHGAGQRARARTRIREDANAEHHGGAINFGNDGKLYFTTGEHFDAAARAGPEQPARQDPPDQPGRHVPTDNPFYDGAGPHWDSIWASACATRSAPTTTRRPGGCSSATSAATTPRPRTRRSTSAPAARTTAGRTSRARARRRARARSTPTRTTGATPRSPAASCTTARSSRAAYQGSYFFADYTQNWIKRLTFDAERQRHRRLQLRARRRLGRRPVRRHRLPDRGPDGALYYLDLGYSDISGTFGVSKIRRIRYVSGNQAPVAIAVGEPDVGPGAARP